MGAYLLLFPKSESYYSHSAFFLCRCSSRFPRSPTWDSGLSVRFFSGVLSVGLPDDVGGVAFWAHVGGFIAGGALCWFFLKSKEEMRPLAPDEWGLEAAWRPLKTASLTELWRNRP